MRTWLKSAGLLSALLASLIAVQSTVALGPAGPSCYDTATQTTYPATQWLDAPGTLTGTKGKDVLVGSTGADIIKGLAGDDIICTSPAENDDEGDLVDAGPGNDSIYGIGNLKGAGGNDSIEAYGEGSVADGGSGQDDVYGGQGANAMGGSGSDEVYVEFGGTADGGSGADLVGGVAATALLGGAGSDFLVNFDGDPLMDCGSAYDYYDTFDPTTTILRCEALEFYCDAGIESFGLVTEASDPTAQC